MRILLVSLLFGCCLSGCEVESDGTTRIEFWAMGREAEAVQALLPGFERANPDIRVSVQPIPWNAAHEKLLTAYVGDHLPDVFQLGNTWIPEFHTVGALEDLTDRLERTHILENFFPGIVETSRMKDGYYGVPWYVDTRLLFYRTDLLDQAGISDPPRSWPQWWRALDRLRTTQGVDRYAMLAPINEWQLPVILALQLGSSLLRDDDRYGDFQGSAFRRAFTFYLDLFRRRWAPAIGDLQLGSVYQEFAHGRFAVYVSGPWNLGEFRRRLPTSLNGRWTTAPFPSPDGQRPGVSIAGGASLTIARKSRNKGAAWKLIEFLSQPAQQVAFYRLTGDLPPGKPAWDSCELTMNHEAQAFRRQLEHVVPVPRIPEWERIAAKIAHYAEKAIRAELDPNTALQHLDREVDTILEKRRWLLEREGL